MIDWNGAVLDYCKSAYGKKRGANIKDKLWYLENRAFFAMRGFTSLGWFTLNYPDTKLTGTAKAYIVEQMVEGEKALDEVIATATYLKKELGKEKAKLCIDT